MKFLFYLFTFTLLFSCSSVSEIKTEDTGVPVPVPVISKENKQITGEQRNPKSAPEEKAPAPAELSAEEMENQILESIPPSFIPVVKKNGHINIIYHDLDRNGYKDAFLLVVKKQKGIKADMESLSDISRLAEKDNVMIDYFLSVFLQINGNMISMYRIPIGSRLILESFSPLYVKTGNHYPFGLNIAFLNEKGTEEEWIIFSSYNRFSFFNAVNDTSSSYEFSDIDRDGFKDVVEWKHGLEEGTGYETYLTWYKWNGKEFREHASTNVVRNLNKFLEDSSSEILNSKWKTFFINRLSDSDYTAAEDSHLGNIVIFNRIFKSEEETPDFQCMDFRSVVFPQIFENPFTSGKKTIDFMVRFDCSDGSRIIRSVKIEMNRNPFGKKQFYFLLN